MQIAIRHRLSLAIGAGVSRSVQHVLLTPLTGPTQTVREWTIDMPGFDRAATFADGFGNRAHASRPPRRPTARCGGRRACAPYPR